MKNIKIIIVLLLIVSNFQLMAQTAFTHRASSSNSSRHITRIDNSVTNGNANKLLFVTQIYNNKYNNHPFGVWYNAGKWTIYQEDKVALEPTTYNVLAVDASDKAFMHKATAENVSSHMTTINHPSCNGNPNAVLLVTQNWKGTYNPKSIAVWYNGSKWVIYNQDRSAMPTGTNFNVLVLPKGNTNISGGKASIFTASAAAKKNNYGQHLANLPYKETDTKLFVTQNYGKSGPYNPHESAVWFDGKNWTVYNKDKTELPKNAQFNILAINILVINATKPLPPDEEIEEIETTPIKPVSKAAGYIRIFNESGYIAKITISYNQNGQLLSKTTGAIAINAERTIEIPKGVSDIKMLMQQSTVVSWADIRTLEFGSNPPNKCYKLYGSAFNPKYNNDCKKKPKGGFVKFFNESGYVAKFTVTYSFNGETIKTETGNLAIGGRKEIDIPNEATNVKIKGEGSTVFSWTEIFNKSYSSPPNKCFKVYATIFSPKWNNNCE